MQNRWPDIAFLGPDFHVPEFSLLVCILQIMREGIRITPKSIIMDKNIINNSKKTSCKMDVSSPPSLDLACPQAKAEIEKYVHMFRDRGVDKK